MKARYTVSGKVRIDLPDDFDTEIKHDPRRYALIVRRVEFEELAEQIKEGDPVRAELKQSLDDALKQIQRLSDDRDHWEQEAANWKRQADSPIRQGLDCSPANVDALRTTVARLERERDNYKRAYELKPAAFRLEGPGAERLKELIPDADSVDELKATIVRQAREITRLTGEGE